MGSGAQIGALMRGTATGGSVRQAAESAPLHVPVLAGEVLELLGVRRGGIYVDATVGTGGHALLICARLEGEGRLIGIDWDPRALEVAEGRLGQWGGMVSLICGNFAVLRRLLKEAGVEEVDGVLMDLGVSSLQLEEAERGFSFRREGPLDMRMSPQVERTAADLLNTAELDELGRIFRELGEVPRARALARAVVRRREREPLRTTADLAEVAQAVMPKAGGGRIHPATNVFRAVRMAVNRELEHLRAGLEEALAVLRPGGRLVVISFHSLEDRIVKECFRRHAGRRESLPAGGERLVVEPPRVRILTPRPVTAGVEELRSNPRARSAKLRAVERLADGA